MARILASCASLIDRKYADPARYREDAGRVFPLPKTWERCYHLHLGTSTDRKGAKLIIKNLPNHPGAIRPTL